MGKTVYAVDEKVLAKLMMAMSPATVSVNADFHSAVMEITSQSPAPQNGVTFK